MYNDNNYNNYGGYAYTQAPAGLTLDQYLSRTFRWMSCGLLVTFGVAYLTAFTSLVNTVVSLYLPLTIAELILVWVMSARMQSMQVSTARGLFLLYSALNGLVLSLYFVIFGVSSMILAFLASAVYFGIMAIYGARTARDLSGWGPKLMGGLIALLICGVVGMLFGTSFVMSVLYSGIGLVIFTLLTAYDTQKLESYYSYYAGQGEMLERASIYGALSLYLDFINIFLFVLRLFGGSRRSN